MKKIEDILKNYKSYETVLGDRFGARFAQFLTEEQMKTIGFELEQGVDHVPMEWTEKNVLAQLKDDVEFGIEKAIGRRGISSSLMHEVCRTWCFVLENGLDIPEDYDDYGLSHFKQIANHYGWEFNYE